MTTYIKNKKINIKYEILEKYTAGIELFGHEVKSVKTSRGSLDGSYVIIRGNEAFLVEAHLTPYQPKNTPPGHEDTRPRRLLLNKKEIAELAEVQKTGNLTIAPISMYNNKNKIKVEIAVVRGKKKHDKRESIKKRDMERDIGRRL